jgi:hypothetical protein
MNLSGGRICYSRLGRARTIFVVSVAIALNVAISDVGYTSSDDDVAAARDAFNEGRRQFDAAQYKAAAVSFRKANELRPNFTIYFNIGQSEAAAKMYGLAFETFERYLAEGGDEITADRRNEVLKELDWLEQMVGAVRISAPEGATVTIDGVERGKAPLPGNLRVAAGVERQVEVVFDGNVIHRATIKVSRREVIAVEAKQISSTLASPQMDSEVGASSPAAASSEQPKPTLKRDAGRYKTFKRVAVITAVVGGALLIGGAVTGAVALSINSDLKSSCEKTICTSSEDKKRLKTRDALSPTSTVLVSVGAVTAAASLPFWILIAKDKNGERETSRITIQPTLGQGLYRLDVSGRF